MWWLKSKPDINSFIKYHGLGEIVVESKPHQRTIISQSITDANDTGFYRISLPYTIFIIKYFSFGIWPLKIYFFRDVFVAFSKNPISESNKSLFRTPFYGSTVCPQSPVCLGSPKRRVFFSLRSMLDGVINRYWQTPFWKALGSISFDGKTIPYIKSWSQLTKENPNVGMEIDWYYLPDIDFFLNGIWPGWKKPENNFTK